MKNESTVKAFLTMLRKEKIPALCFVGNGDGLTGVNGTRRDLIQMIKRPFDRKKKGLASEGDLILCDVIVDAITLAFSPGQITQIMANRTDMLMKEFGNKDEDNI